ncbi:MAG: hypothetical protein NTY07_09345 [Bacteroidia bacterium]|nr:hypothetical protein [Bacteroidia bacterium]
MNENQYKELCVACDRVLLAPDSSIERVAIPWLHVIREHPIVLAKYENLFISATDSIGVLSHWIKYFLKKAKWVRQILRAFRSNGQPLFGVDVLPEKVDFLFISHFLSTAQACQKEDFYFGNMPNDLVSCNRSVVIALINQSGASFASFRGNCVTSKAARVYLSNSLKLSDEFVLHRRLKRESLQLLRLAKSEAPGLFQGVLKHASQEAMDNNSMTSLRLAHQIRVLVKKLRPQAIVVTHEGHSFERLAFAVAREVSPTIKCIAYQHAGVYRLSHAIRRNLSPQYNPDIIFTTGTDGKIELEKAFGTKNMRISVLGSSRGLIERTNNCENSMPKQKEHSTMHDCLVIPEGIDSECLRLFEFSLLCAKEQPNITFIWRLHPITIFKKLTTKNPDLKRLPTNIILSSYSLEEDIERCSWALYRGTTAIYKAISGGLRPIYLRIPGEMTIDPLYNMHSWRVIVDSPSDLLSCITNDIENGMQDNKKYINIAQEICEKRYTKINLDVLNSVIPY